MDVVARVIGRCEPKAQLGARKKRDGVEDLKALRRTQSRFPQYIIQPLCSGNIYSYLTNL
jgi:hypothetical protein